MEIIQNEIIELTTTEKSELASIFVNMINSIKNDITNQ